MTLAQIIQSTANGPDEASSGRGIRPVVFDILAPDKKTSLLADDIRLVLHVNPSTMKPSYSKVIERVQTQDGWVLFHWGDAPSEVTFEGSTGGLVRLYSGLSNITGPTSSNSLIKPTTLQAQSLGGTRQDTIAYDKYKDILALYKNNGAIYDTHGNIAYQGQIKMIFDDGNWYGWFTSFSVDESVDKPYQFRLSASFTVEREFHLLRSIPSPSSSTTNVTPRLSDRAF